MRLLPPYRPSLCRAAALIAGVLVANTALANTAPVDTAPMHTAAAIRASANVTRAAAASFTVRDDLGQPVTLPQSPVRIASLSPGATEMLFAAGADSRVVATVEYSDEPAAARAVPRIGDVVAIDMERLLAARPQVVVAWPGGGNIAQVGAIERLGIPIYREQVNRLDDLGASLRRLGALMSTSEAAERAAHALEAKVAELASTYRTTTPRTVLLQVWNHPLYTLGGGQLISDVLRICGTRNIFSDLTDQAPAVDPEAVIARDPDIIVAASPPGAGAQWIADWQRFKSLRAVRRGNLFVFEDQRLTRLGPSVIDAAAGLCALLATAH
ncbi:MAG: ABC transporter substrate-binding protein [Sinobacteraceae bacterium]|nr:ABC transporter substrate-binding protein [Nevskiaceae bacterium]